MEILILGIGNVLMGDEGAGVHAIRLLAEKKWPPGVRVLDGGTGSFTLLEPMQNAEHIIMIDATIDGQPAGTVTRLQPRFSGDYPRALTAHDIGLKDLLDSFYLLGKTPRVTLFAVSIEPLREMDLELSAPVAACLPELIRHIEGEVEALLAGREPAPD